ncbi:MAG: efflux RND transporter periplasmic adaptor subunit, partial [Rubrivivax sp.]
MNKRWVVGGIAAVVVLGAGSAAWFGGVFRGGEAQATAAKGPPGKDNAKAVVALEFTSREVTQPLMARLPTRLEFSGPLVAPETAIVRAKAGGTLLSLSVAEGQRVRAGQVLGRLDLSELGTRVAEREALVASARARLAQAERTHASNQGLAAQQFISPVALDASRSALDTARADLAAAQAALDTTRVGVRDAQLVAPIDGIVAKRHAVPGERMQPEQPLLTVVDLRRLELAGMVGTHEVSRLS